MTDTPAVDNPRVLGLLTNNSLLNVATLEHKKGPTREGDSAVARIRFSEIGTAAQPR